MRPGVGAFTVALLVAACSPSPVTSVRPSATPSSSVVTNQSPAALRL